MSPAEPSGALPAMTANPDIGSGDPTSARDELGDTLSAARGYCRSILPRVSRTFAINIRLLRGSMAEAVRTAYLLCRAADALEDSWPGEPAHIRRRFALLLASIAGDEEAARTLALEAGTVAGRGADLELLVHLPRVLRCYRSLSVDERGAVSEGVRTLANGMCRYAARAAARRDGGPTPYLENEAELHEYCWVVAGCVGVMLTRLFAIRAPAEDALARSRIERAPAVGEALQLTNILLDWPTDMREGRCYVPRTWLEEYGLTIGDLVAPGDDAATVSGPAAAIEADEMSARDRAASSIHADAADDLAHSRTQRAQAVATRLESLARAALARVPDYLETIPARHSRYRLFCLWPALWARRSLEHARRDPHFPLGPRRPRLPRGELWGAAVGSLLYAHDSTAVRRVLG
jgi:farnesyl-diphosphate farnesyltransferase